MSTAAVSKQIEMTQRLFLAVELPEALVSALEDHVSGRRPEFRGCRWTAPENIHITLYFFGDVEDGDSGRLQEALRDACRGIGMFALTMEGITAAPPGRPPTMIWATFREHPSFRALQDAVYREAGAVIALDPPKRVPHATLARCRRGLPVDVSVDQGTIWSDPIEVDSCSLFASTLTDDGPIYERVAVFALGTG